MMSRENFRGAIINVLDILWNFLIFSAGHT
jgi:hypothetical protein